MIKWLKSKWKAIRRIIRGKDPQHKQILTLLEKLSTKEITPYSMISTLNSNYPNIIEVNRVIESILSTNLKTSTLKLKSYEPCNVKIYSWFSNNYRLITEYEKEWSNLLTNYTKVVNTYFRYKSDTTPILATNMVRVRGHVYNIYNTLKQLELDT